MGLQIFMAKDRLHYCGLVRGPHGENNRKCYICLNYCVIFSVHKEFTNVAAGLKIQHGGPHAIRWQRVGDPRLSF